ncbi:MAG: HlyC/CorC family transporter [Bacteroidetes bacterium]|uniref:HlyC/CorC family transporter n=1 Tax=Candidatus Cryptobacteroides gallistercoris TaxID=2840765 RepID=A0A940DMT8_9BACT|nr:HlyC/CorC family transporter [Candidatus Cryptobacteroides gallistercoris]
MSEIFIILLLILLNGIFAMSEMAVISARKSNLQADANKGSKTAKTALKLASDPDKFLSAVQIGITLIGILTGIFSGKSIADALSAALAKAGMSAGVAGALAQGIIVILVTYLSIVFGELVPKRIALSASERVSKIVSGPMKVISVLASPFVWVLAKSTSFIINILGIKSQESKVTEEEIKSIIQEGTDEGEVSPVEQDIVERVFALGDLKVNTIMTLRGDIVWLDKDMGEAEIRETIEKNLFETYPVTDGDLDHVIGVLSLKDYVLNIGKKQFSLEEMIHEPVYFHENMSVYAVLEQMKIKRISRALVCDEFGFCSGIITLKDIMEALVGIVNDDHQKEPDIIARQDNDGWFVDGQCSMYDFKMYFDIDDDDADSAEYTTVGGLILDELEHVPISGEKATWKDFSFEVVDMDGARIDKVIVKRKPRPEPEPQNDKSEKKD